MNCLNLVNGTQNNNIKNAKNALKNKNRNGVPTHIQNTKEDEFHQLDEQHSP
jgi:hypothetical protein